MRAAAVLAVSTVLVAGCRPEGAGGRLGSRGSSGSPETAPLFRDVTAQSGIDPRIETGARGEHYLIETMAGGLGWIDYDRDGDLDLYVASGHSRPARAGEAGPESNRLYRNEGGGRFVDVTEESGVGDRHYSIGVAVGDIDADGDPDLVVLNFGRNTLYRNRGDGTFEDATVAAGLVEIGYSVSAAFFDLEGDGDLDLYIARYLAYDPRYSRPCLERGARVYCHPRYFPGQTDLLYENLGGGRFREIARRAGVARAGRADGKGLGVIATDFDLDGRVDLYVANDTTPNYLWHNLGGGRFEEVGYERGVAVDSHGRPQAGMGIDWGDVDGDGELEIWVTNFFRETNSLYDGNGTREDVVQRAGLGGTYLRLGFGTRVEDFDLDGNLDIVVANGHVDDEVERYASGSGAHYRQPPDLWLGEGGGRFGKAEARRAGSPFAEPIVGRGLATCDWDDDGDLDVALGTLDRGVVLLRNDTPARQRRVRLELVGPPGNPAAYNARVRVVVGKTTRLYEIQSARSYGSAVDPRLVIGLGKEKAIDELEITWPDGRVERRRNLPAGTRARIVEGEGAGGERGTGTQVGK